MSLANYFIDRISFEVASKIVIKHHYLHRVSPFTHGFGLFENNPDSFFPLLKGVVIYGSPASSTLCEGICGKQYKDQVIELTRLWIDDSVPKNGESFLIGNTIPKLDKDIIVSFADTVQGHIGKVYQATNFIYTGLSEKRTDWVVDGISKHGKTLSDKYTVEQMKEIYGDKFSLKERSRKHRYIFFKGNKWRKKELLSALKYEILPYPKLKEGTELGS